MADETPRVARIEKLTPEQEARLPGIREEWLSIGLSTEPADRSRAENGARLAYQLAKLPEPQHAVWLSSPSAGCVGAAILAAYEGPGKWNAKSDKQFDQADEVAASIREQTGLQVEGWYPSQASVRSQLNLCGWGQHDTWLSFCWAFREFGLEAAYELDGLFEIARASGWWWPFDQAVILTDRPKELHLDAQQRLHAENGPAMSYRDGFDLYVWHGTRVPKTLIDPGWDAKTILKEPDQEVRRSAIERVGWDQFIEDAKLKQVGKPADDPGNAGQTLTLYDVPERLYGTAVRVLLCTNGTIERDGTRRRFGLTVPATINDPIEAAAWTYNWPKEDYEQLEIRR